MEVELTEHVATSRTASRLAGRNQRTARRRRRICEHGKVAIDAPRDREGAEPKIVRKRQRRSSGTRRSWRCTAAGSRAGYRGASGGDLWREGRPGADLEGHRRGMDDVREWAKRPLEDVYPTCLDAWHKIREGGSVQRRALYLALGAHGGRPRRAGSGPGDRGRQVWMQVLTDLKGAGARHLICCETGDRNTEAKRRTKQDRPNQRGTNANTEVRATQRERAGERDPSRTHRRRSRTGKERRGTKRRGEGGGTRRGKEREKGKKRERRKEKKKKEEGKEREKRREERKEKKKEEKEGKKEKEKKKERKKERPHISRQPSRDPLSAGCRDGITFGSAVVAGGGLRRQGAGVGTMRIESERAKWGPAKRARPGGICSVTVQQRSVTWSSRPRCTRTKPMSSST